MTVKRFIEWVSRIKRNCERGRERREQEKEREGEKIPRPYERTVETSKVNRFGVSLPESTGLAKHSRVFETSGLVSEQGLKQGGFKSLKRNSVEGQRHSHKYPPKKVFATFHQETLVMIIVFGN